MTNKGQTHFLDTADGLKPLPSEAHVVTPPPSLKPYLKGTFEGASIPPPRRVASSSVLRKIKDGGLLQLAGLFVYETLFRVGPATAGEITAELLQDPANQHIVNPSYHKRLPELERRGVVRRIGKRTCKVTEKVCDLWDVTEALPAESKQSVARTHSVLSCGPTLRQCILNFTDPIGWKVKDIVEGRSNKRFHWTQTVVTESGESFRAAGLRVPGGYVLSLWK
jgi:hypothetical protein